MIRLFSRFDLGFFALSIIVFILFLVNLFNISYKLRFFKEIIIRVKIIIEKFFIRIKRQIMKSTNIILILVFTTILAINFSSVLSYNFAYTTQLSITIFITLRVWLTLNLFKLTQTIKGFLSHCIPEGTPMYLTIFLFLIEIIRNTIRPLTATVRIVANITAGHVLMILLSKIVIIYTITAFAYLLLNGIELAVAIIQAYIFTTIICLYISEIQ